MSEFDPSAARDHVVQLSPHVLAEHPATVLTVEDGWLTLTARNGFRRYEPGEYQRVLVQIETEANREEPA